MNLELTAAQQVLQKEFRTFVQTELQPYANDYDRQGAIPMELIRKLGAQGYLGATIPVAYGGRGIDQVSYGLLNEEIGRACSSTRSLVTVHSSLTAETILRWGAKAQKDEWLPLLATGTKLAAFGLSEPDAGSDTAGIKTTYREVNGSYQLNGAKKWITFAQTADLYMIAAQGEHGITTFLVERNTPGLTVVPMDGILGTRASMLAELHLQNCIVPAENILGRKGWGLQQIVNTALDNGRYSVACGSLGIARACLEDSIRYAKTRTAFGQPLKDHQLIKQKIANMVTEVKAATLLCRNAGYLRDKKDPDSFIQTSLAKYHASRIANVIASDAVQLHGAMGCHDSISIQRYFRDAKVMEIIEGSTEIQQILIADHSIASLSSIL
ncbi:MAG TPA: acyl-CoA dehydrogenase family protein [Chitinophaga sp.]|uniref:acyl-CoA dehydrogenase family protein n=1 Tax=Chitinophaga sp. TaxID=1869181 RepID=UPI002B9C0F3A|nr:acyl-CoA dehydrogenase family protein [Chitinophaga sp.]HVI45631.1 acyl-CoA dehydrogenase family protein [Chitinophaga sp.]